MINVGFLVNPIAGMGGSVGLKGTDNLYIEALKRGAKQVAPLRAKRFLKRLMEIGVRGIFFYTAPSIMGEDYLKETHYEYRVVGKIRIPTTRHDTINISRSLLGKIDILIFVGGDGTARDILEAVDGEIPVIGVPSGVKMFSSVFTYNPEKAAELLDKYIDGEVIVHNGEVFDVDEDSYRRDIIRTRLYGYLKTPYIPGYIQGSKMPLPIEDFRDEIRSIAEYVIENMERNILYITSPGNTVKEIHRMLNIGYTLLGVDAIYNKKLVGMDLDEKTLLNIISKYGEAKIIVSPIGGQGLIFGRGNQVLTPRIITRVGIENIIVISPIWKLQTFNCLWVDTGDIGLDSSFPRYLKVLIRYGEFKIIKRCE